MSTNNKAQQIQTSFLDLSKFLQRLAPGQIKGICLFVNPTGALDINFPLINHVLRQISLEQLQNLISLASKRFYLQEGYTPDLNHPEQTKIPPNDFGNETEQFIQFYHIYALSRLLRELSQQQLMKLFDIVPLAVPQIEQLQLLQQIQQLMVQLHPETLRELHDELIETPGNEIQQLINMNILKPEHFNLYRPLAILLTLDISDLHQFQQLLPKLEPIQLMQITKLIEVGPFEALELQNLLSPRETQNLQSQVSTNSNIQTSTKTENESNVFSLSTTQQTQPPQATAHPIQTIQLKFVDQPPEKCVYKRNVKPPPVIQIVGGDNFENDGNLYIVVTLIRCDTFQEAPHLLTGNKPVRVTSARVIPFKRLKILCTSHQLNETLFCLQFSLRRYNGNEYVTLHTITSTPICVLSHSTQLKPILSALPIVTEVIPVSGPPSGFTRVAVLGSNFADSPTTRVRFDEIEVMPIFHGPKTLICHTPKHPPGTVMVRVCNDAKRWSDTAGTFTYDENLSEENEKIIVDAPFQLGLEESSTSVSPKNTPSQQSPSYQSSSFTLNETPSNNYPPLHYTSALGNVDATKALLKMGVPLETSDKWGNTALHWAARADQTAIIELLIRHGKSSLQRPIRLTELCNQNGDTPLHVAVIEGHYDAVHTLIQCGSSLNRQNLDGLTPLHAAVLIGNIKIVELLLKHGAYVSIPDFEGDPPLHWAVRCGHVEIAQFLLDKGALLESRNEDLETPLLLATSIRDHKLVTLLLSRGAQLNVRDKEGMNPLHWAVLGNDFNCVVAILKHLYKSSSHHQATQFLHSLLRSQEKSGYTPLTLAQVCGHKEIVSLLSNTDQGIPSEDCPPSHTSFITTLKTCPSQNPECKIYTFSLSSLSQQTSCFQTHTNERQTMIIQL